MKRLLSILFAVLLTINSTFVASPVLAEDDLSNEEVVETTNEDGTFEKQEDNVLKCQELIDALPENINVDNVNDVEDKILEIEVLLKSLNEEEIKQLSLEKLNSAKTKIDNILNTIDNNYNNEEDNGDYFYVPESAFNYIEEQENPFIKKKKKTLSLQKGVDTLPSSFSLVTEKHVTPVRNQMGWGTCWSFAAIASAESNFLVKNNKTCDELDIDLSELHLAWYGYNNYKVKDSLNLITFDGNEILPDTKSTKIQFGGNQQMATYMLASGIGINVESDMPYPSYAYFADEERDGEPYLDYYADDNVTSKLCYSNDYILSQVEWYDMEDVEAIKHALMNKGALAISYRHYPGTAEEQKTNGFFDYYGINGYSYFYSSDPSNKSTNHAVTLVGWDDEYSRDNFGKDGKPKPSSDGAWLAKNSWGTSVCNNGYFYISYEEASVKGGAYGYSIIDKEGYEYDVYQYDGSSFFDYETNGTDTIYAANVYVTDKNEKIEKVGIASNNSNLKYEIKLYLNPTTSPTSGTLLTTKAGILENAGYSLIDIDDDIRIKKGDTFSVVVRYEDLDGSVVALPVDGNFIQITTGGGAIHWMNDSSIGQSFMSDDGVYFDDLNTRIESARIKALGIPYYDIEYVLYDGTNSTNNPDQYIQNEIITFEEPTKEGYYFEGWYTNDDFDSEDKITSTEGHNEDLSLYAHWLPIINKMEFYITDPVAGESPDYTVTATINDDAISSDDAFDLFELLWNDDDSHVLTSNTFFWPGKTFIGYVNVEIDKSEYYLAQGDDLTVTINDATVNYDSGTNCDAADVYNRYYGRSIGCDDQTVGIISLEINGISFPKAGATYDKDLNDVVALVNGTKDDDIKVEYDWYDNETKTTPSVSFVDKQIYYLFVTVTIDKDTCEYYDLTNVPGVLKINEQDVDKPEESILVDKSSQNDDGKCKQITFYKKVKCRQNPVIVFDENMGITDNMTVYIDGLPKTVHLVDDVLEIDITDTNVGIATTYVTSISTGISDGNEIHSKYPSSMNVYFLNKTSEGHVKAVKNDYYTDIMKYSGTAVRITGNRGLRFKTSIDASKNAQLVNGNYEGYVAAEYGTMMCWKNDLQPGEEPALVKQANGTYLPKYGSKGVAFDRKQGIYKLFSMDSSKVVYTGVLVGEYTDLQCGNDFTYRTYLVLRPKDATDSSEDLIIYGGTMYRSISYVALQARNDPALKTKGSPEYEYVWRLIRATYGHDYDEPEE